MDQSLAYHAVVNAMEAKSGWTPMSRFASAVCHAIRGHVPYERYRAAALSRAVEGTSEGAIEGLVCDFLDTDLNPLLSFAAAFRRPAGVVAAFNAYNESARLGVRTNILAESVRAPIGPARAQRRPVASGEDPSLCRVGTMAALDSVLRRAGREVAGALPHGAHSLASVANRLGVQHTAAAEVAMVFEVEGHASIGHVASRLGCHRRTLERRLRQLGVTAESLGQASRLARSAARLSSPDSLASIAADEGFSDLAHMTRSFQTSCGMPPSLMRRLLWADAATAPQG